MISLNSYMLRAVLLCAFIFNLTGILYAEEEGLSPTTADLRCQLLLQDYLGKKVKVTVNDGKKIKGKLIAANAQLLKIIVKKEVKTIPVAEIKRIEFTGSVPGEIGKSVGGVLLGIGVAIGGLFIVALIYSGIH
jgi:small nuclear ribonucleoprotein (snRNP)-like protein